MGRRFDCAPVDHRTVEVTSEIDHLSVGSRIVLDGLLPESAIGTPHFRGSLGGREFLQEMKVLLYAVADKRLPLAVQFDAALPQIVA